jgi:hypothetical protein
MVADAHFYFIVGYLIGHTYLFFVPAFSTDNGKSVSASENFLPISVYYSSSWANFYFEPNLYIFHVFDTQWSAVISFGP